MYGKMAGIPYLKETPEKGLSGIGKAVIEPEGITTGTLKAIINFRGGFEVKSLN